MSSLPPIVSQGVLPTSTIVPRGNEDIFITYLTRLYEDIASAVNGKDVLFFSSPITSTATNIPNLANFGSFVVSVSGSTSTLPTIVVALTKADSGASGTIAVLGFQVGTGAWAGNALTITSTTTNFQIKHNRTGVTGNFNIRIIGTQ